MTDMYRLEACAVCRVVRMAIVTAVKRQAMLDGRDMPEHVGAAEVWTIDCCETCRAEWERVSHD